MPYLKVKVLDSAGSTLANCDPSEKCTLVYTSEYKQGDWIAMEVSEPGQFCVVQLEDTMPPALVYLAATSLHFHIPMGEQAITYSPKSFKGNRHVIRARLATEAEVAARRCMSFNPYDIHGEAKVFPHASANVETRGEAVFAARNAIDGVFENNSHGEYPYQSWGINRDPEAAITVDFGREIMMDGIRITERADFPHDSHWIAARITCSDGSVKELSLVKTAEPQAFSFEPIKTSSVVLSHLIQADDPSPFPALTQIEVYGTEV